MNTNSRYFTKSVFIFFQLGVIVVSLNATAQNFPGRRIAAVIGNDFYKNVGQLEKAGSDAKAMARELQNAGFEVALHQNLDYRGMVKAIEALKNKINAGDQVVFFLLDTVYRLRLAAICCPQI